MIASQRLSGFDIVSQAEGNIVSDMGGEKVMLSIHNGKYYNLGEIGGEIWEQIQEPIAVWELITLLTVLYEVEQAECEKQVIPFLIHLVKEGLVQVEAGSSS